MPKLRINPLARKDLIEIKEYIIQETCDSNISSNTIDMIFSKAIMLETMPLMGESLQSKIDMITDYHYLVAGSYLIFYKADKEYISMYRVIHSRRDFAKVLFG